MRLRFLSFLILANLVQVAVGFTLPKVSDKKAELTPLGAYVGQAPATNGKMYAIRMELWLLHGKPMGILLIEKDRLTRRSPVGFIEEVTFNPKSKFLGFKSKMTLGLYKGPATDSTTVPSRDAVEFNGTMQLDRVEGKLEWVNQAREEGLFTFSNIRLDLDDKNPVKLEKYADWRKRWQSALDLRGPRW